MDQYPNGSMGEAENKSHKLFTWIAIVAAIAGHILFYLVSANKFGLMHSYPVLWLAPAVFVTVLVIVIKAVLADKDWVTLSPWPYIGLLLLAAVSILSMTYCPQC